jgi:hypothetical protein
MGTWDETLLGGDAAMDRLGDIRQAIELERSATHLAVGVGLRLWIDPVELDGDPDEPGSLVGAIERHRDWLAALPAPARVELEAIAADPAAVAERPGDTGPHDDVVGYPAGPRLDALLAVPGAEPILDDVVTAIAADLDDAFSRETDLYELTGELAGLAVLVRLTALGRRPPADVVAGWRERFAAIDTATPDERGFWDAYAANVRAALGALAAR